MYKVKLIICHTTTNLMNPDIGIWEIVEVEVSEELWDRRDELAIVADRYTNGVKFVGVYDWIE